MAIPPDDHERWNDRNCRDQQWADLAAWLSRISEASSMTLETAQRLFDAAPDQELSGVVIQSLVRRIVQRMAADQKSSCGVSDGDLIFSADTLGAAISWNLGTATAPHLIGLHGVDLDADLITDFDSCSVDTRRLNYPGTSISRRSLETMTDPIVLDVGSCCDELAGPQLRTVRQGTMRRDAFLDRSDGAGVEVDAICGTWCGWVNGMGDVIEELLKDQEGHSEF